MLNTHFLRLSLTELLRSLRTFLIAFLSVRLGGENSATKEMDGDRLSRFASLTNHVYTLAKTTCEARLCNYLVFVKNQRLRSRSLSRQ